MRRCTGAMCDCGRTTHSVTGIHLVEPDPNFSCNKSRRLRTIGPQHVFFCFWYRIQEAVLRMCLPDFLLPCPRRAQPPNSHCWSTCKRTHTHVTLSAGWQQLPPAADKPASWQPSHLLQYLLTRSFEQSLLPPSHSIRNPDHQPFIAQALTHRNPFFSGTKAAQR